MGKSQSKLFNNLEFAEDYLICVQLGVNWPNYNKCVSMCLQKSKDWCKAVSTNCEFLPAPTKTLKPIEWSNDNKFDPFTKIIFTMEIGTFDGETSGLHEFFIRCIYSYNKFLLHYDGTNSSI